MSSRYPSRKTKKSSKDVDGETGLESSDDDLAPDTAITTAGISATSLSFDERRTLLQLEMEKLKLEKDLEETKQKRPADVKTDTGGKSKSKFEVYKASSILPAFDENNVELFFENFEKQAVINEWPADKWGIIVQAKMAGKALKAFERLSVDDMRDYDTVKDAVLDELERVAEDYRRRFRFTNKRNDESYSDFAKFLTVQFKRWIKSLDITSKNGLIEAMLIEQFKDKVSDDLRYYLADKDENTVLGVAKLADEFTAIHRKSRAGSGHGNDDMHARRYDSGRRNDNYDKHDKRNASKYDNRDTSRKDFVDRSNPSGNNGKKDAVSPKEDGEQPSRIICYYCHAPNHKKSECPKRKADSKSMVGRADLTNKKQASDVSDYLVPITVCDATGKSNTDIMCWRDTGSQISLLLEGAIPDECMIKLDKKVCVIGVSSVNHVEVPLAKINVSSNMVKGEIIVAVTPKNFGLPNKEYPFILGNDFGPRLQWEGKPKYSGAVTRNQSKMHKLNDVTNPTGCDNAIAGDVNNAGLGFKDAGVNVAGDLHNAHDVTADLHVIGDLHDSVLDAVHTGSDLEKSNDPVQTINDDKVFVADDDTIGSLQNLFSSNDGSCKLTDVSRSELVKMQRDDPYLKEIIDNVKSVGNDYHGYFIHSNGLLMRSTKSVGENVHVVADDSIPQIVVPKVLRSKLLDLSHSVASSGHLGIGKTRKRLCRYFFWGGVNRDLKNYINSCSTCQRNNKNGKTPKAPMIKMPIIGKPFERISIDIVGPLTETKNHNRFVLTIADHATHWIEGYCLPDHKTTTVVKALLDFIARFGIPGSILSDLGTDLNAELMQVLLSYYGVAHVKTSVSHPQTNNQCERFHRTMKQMIRAFLDQYDADWDEALCHLLFAVREVPIAEYGFSAYELLFGRYVRGPLSIVYDAWWEAEENNVSTHVVDYMMQLRERLDTAMEYANNRQAEAQEKTKVYYDKKARAEEYKPGDLVLVYSPQPGKPLAMKYIGPFKCLKQTSPVDYLIEFPDGRKKTKVIHANSLKRYLVRHSENDKELSNVNVESNNEISGNTVIDNVNKEIAGCVLCNMPCCGGVISEAADEDDVEQWLLGGNPRPQNYNILLAEKTSHLSADQAAIIQDVVNQHNQVVSDLPGCTNLYTHAIKLKPNAKVVHMKPYRLSPKHKELLKIEIDKLLKAGLIKESNSEWSSACILVPKSDGGVRCVIDYRGLNLCVEDESWPMPRIDDLIDQIGQDKFLTKIDLSNSFLQIKLDPESTKYTSFCTPFGQFEYLRLPYGLKSSPLKFSCMISKALYGLDEFCGMYIDDIIVHSKTFEDHVRHVSIVFDRLCKANLTVRLCKCFFCVDKVDYVGHNVGNGQMSPREARIQSLADTARPIDRKTLRSFLGMTGFFQKYIPKYSDLTSPLTDLLRKGQPFKWTVAQENSFTVLKDFLCRKPILQIADFSKPFILFVDASGVAAGASLMQPNDNGDLLPVCYFSKKFVGAQKNYTTRDLEALALVLAVKAFRIYLQGPVTVYSDHEPLKYIHSMSTTNQRMLRYSLELQPYQLTVKHIKGRDNCVADYLSRPVINVHDID